MLGESASVTRKRTDRPAHCVPSSFAGRIVLPGCVHRDKVRSSGREEPFRSLVRITHTQAARCTRSVCLFAKHERGDRRRPTEEEDEEEESRADATTHSPFTFYGPRKS
ncbi:hypothetical protein Q1695_009771 [Nippostrongylus brasiliensis]|nr:hypothetical protein Q1695_009771 [Nippostrongylus brasiliensis]